MRKTQNCLMRAELGSAKMEQEIMEEWCSRAALRIVDSMSEVELKDTLPTRVHHSMATYPKAVDKGRSAAAEASLQLIA